MKKEAASRLLAVPVGDTGEAYREVERTSRFSLLQRSLRPYSLRERYGHYIYLYSSKCHLNYHVTPLTSYAGSQQDETPNDFCVRKPRLFNIRLQACSIFAAMRSANILRTITETLCHIENQTFRRLPEIPSVSVLAIEYCDKINFSCSFNKSWTFSPEHYLA